MGRRRKCPHLCGRISTSIASSLVDPALRCTSVEEQLYAWTVAQVAIKSRSELGRQSGIGLAVGSDTQLGRGDFSKSAGVALPRRGANGTKA
jgi:hypothetical protein